MDADRNIDRCIPIGTKTCSNDLCVNPNHLADLRKPMKSMHTTKNGCENIANDAKHTRENSANSVCDTEVPEQWMQETCKTTEIVSNLDDFQKIWVNPELDVHSIIPHDDEKQIAIVCIFLGYLLFLSLYLYNL